MFHLLQFGEFKVKGPIDLRDQPVNRSTISYFL